MEQRCNHGVYTHCHIDVIRPSDYSCVVLKFFIFSSFGVSESVAIKTTDGRMKDDNDAKHDDVKLRAV